MTKYLYLIMIPLVTLLLVATGYCANDVTLSWDPSPTPSVIGYKVYYKQNDANLPTTNTSTKAGPSPVDITKSPSPLDVENSLSTTLTGFSDNKTYFFTVTAYDGAGTESSISNIVSKTFSTLPIIGLVSPPNGASNEPVPTTFQWSTSLGLEYTLYYGTDSNLSTAIVPTGTTSAPQIPPHVIAVAILSVLLLMAAITLYRKPRPFIYFSAAALFTLVTACGGGGGGGDSDTTKTATDPPAEPPSVYEVYKGSSDYHQAYDLESNTTYYWKVTGVDPNDPTQTYTSETYSFTTENF